MNYWKMVLKMKMFGIRTTFGYYWVNLLLVKCYVVTCIVSTREKNDLVYFLKVLVDYSIS